MEPGNSVAGLFFAGVSFFELFVRYCIVWFPGNNRFPTRRVLI
jgi:uncharacterized protein YggT (Ycf19 family)